jgi:succinate dehydrogenase (ubiquinone) iron-sulfur subunit
LAAPPAPSLARARPPVALHSVPAIAAEASKVKYFKIYRYDPEVPGQKPYIATYALNLDECVYARACVPIRGGSRPSRALARAKEHPPRHRRAPASLPAAQVRADGARRAAEDQE